MKLSATKGIITGMLALAATAFTSCDAVYEPEENNCVVNYKVRFRYDRNMKFADAFAPEVDEVTLYLVDNTGKVVWHKTENGEPLTREDYLMNVDVAPGTYSLLAWCSSAEPSTFTRDYDGSSNGLKVHFTTKTREDGSEHITDKIDRLYHGYVADVKFPEAEEGNFIFTVPLTKDTNHILVTLQQLSGDPIPHNLVEFEITDDNAHLDWDNSLIKGRPLTYHQWHSQTVTADLSATEVRAENSTFGGVIAELTTSRLMKESDARLHVYRNDTGATIASIRLIDALLLAMGYDNIRRLTPQQYLDYKDDYSLTFFLDENHLWFNCLIQIGPWRLVYKDQEVN